MQPTDPTPAVEATVAEPATDAELDELVEDEFLDDPWPYWGEFSEFDLDGIIFDDEDY